MAGKFRRVRIDYKGRKNGWDKLKIVAIWLWIFTVIAVGGAFLMQNRSIQNGFIGNIVVETLEFEPVDNIYISTNNLDINVEYYYGDNIIIDYINDSRIVIDDENELQLRISQDDAITLTLFSFRQPQYAMNVRLPVAVYDELSFSSTGGSISCTGMTANLLDVSTKSGDISLYEADGSINAASVSGNVNVDFIAFTGECNIINDEGNVDLSLPADSAINLSYSTSGGYLNCNLFKTPLNRFSEDIITGKGIRRNWLYVSANLGVTQILTAEN